MKLTGKIVGDVAENNWHDLMDEYGVEEYARYGYSQLPQEGYDWGAIAKELNDMLEPETCYNTQFAEMDEKANKKHRRAISSVLYGRAFPEDETAEFTCSACGKTALIDWETLYDIRFCPFCGRKVVDE